MENSTGVPQNISTVAIWSSNSPTGYMSKENEISMLIYLHSCIHCNTIHSSQEMESSIHQEIKWIKNMIYKPSVIFLFVTVWVNLKDVLSEINQRQYRMFSLVETQKVELRSRVKGWFHRLRERGNRELFIKTAQTNGCLSTLKKKE